MTKPTDTEPELSPKQRLFVEHYLANDGNATQAAIAAGYNAKNARVIGSQNLTKLNIRQCIDTEINRRCHALELTFNWKCQQLKSAIEKALSGEAFNGRPQLREVIAAVAELNKMQGHYAPTQSVNANVNTEVDWARVEELIARYKREY